MQSRSALLVVFAVALAATAVRTCAQEYQKLRYDEDWSFLADRARRTDFWDGVKYVPLTSDGDAYLSFGGEARLRYELFHNYRWDPDAPDQDGYLLERFLLSGDLHVSKRLRVFGQLQSSIQNWREGGPRGTDEDQLDFHQLFTDVVFGAKESSVTLRIGRQEMLYGSQRLVSVRESPNIRRSFDAIRALGRHGDWRIDAFVSRPVEDDPGVFDDWGDDDAQFWGVYATHPLRCLRGFSLDLYYLGLDRPDAEFVQGTAHERRHSLGTRFFGKRGAWDYNFEAVLQVGSFGDGDILAWTVASDTGYTLAGLPLEPRVGLRADVISGDTDPASSRLGTFNAMFPRGAYFSEAGVIGPADLIDLHPTLELHASESVKVSADWDVLWRYTTGDGIYDNGGNVLRSNAGSSSFIGHQAALQVDWQIDRHTSLSAAYSHFFPGAYIKESGPGGPMDFVAVWMIYRF